MNPVRPFPWLIALLIALTSFLACACITATLLLLHRRRYIRSEPDAPVKEYPGGQDRWIAYYPDPPPPDALHVFSQADLFDDKQFAPKVTPQGVVPPWYQEPPPVDLASIHPARPVAIDMDFHPAAQLTPGPPPPLSPGSVVYSPTAASPFSAGGSPYAQVLRPHGAGGGESPAELAQRYR